MRIEELVKKNLLTLCIAGAALIIIIVSVIYIKANNSITASDVYTKNKQYQKIVVLYNKLEKCKKTKKLFSNNLFSLVQILKRQGHLNGKILSVTPLLNETTETIDIKLKTLNLREFLYLIEKIDSYNNIDIKHFALTKDFTIPDLIDLDLVIQKSE